MAPYGAINDPFVLYHPPPHKGSIFFSDSPIFKLQGKVTKRFFMLGHNHDTRGVLVQPVDNSGASLSSDALQVRTVMEKGVDQGASRITSGRMNHHARGFIDDNKILILMKNGDV
jgi:hypothetical protein